MKKFLVILLSLVVLVSACTYIFIPSTLHISKAEYSKVNVYGAYRVLSNKNTWTKWWPGHSASSSNNNDSSDTRIFYYKGFSYQLSQKYYNSIEVQMRTKHSTIDSRIILIKIKNDSIILDWKCNLGTSINPITRILKYSEAEKIRNNMTDILSNLSSFLDDQKNIYGVKFNLTMSKDSTMVLTKKISKKYPTTSDIYELVGKLKNYIGSNNAKESNYPMLHVKVLDDSTYETMVAIPINKRLSGNRTISYSRFVPWKVITAEVSGGNKTVEDALNQMKIFISDYQISPMAIPFESLVTDRSTQPDTTKWVTRIYTPVP
jgi:hypothetical protein